MAQIKLNRNEVKAAIATYISKQFNVVAGIEEIELTSYGDSATWEPIEPIEEPTLEDVREELDKIA